MDSASHTAPFRFERTFALSEDRYAGLWSNLGLRSPWMLVFLLLFLALAVACLFWPYTLGLGVALLVVWLVLLLLLWFGGIARGMVYRVSKELHETTTYGANEEAFWLRSPTLEGRAAWRRLRTWRETAGLLVLWARGLQPVYLPVEALKSEGLYEVVLELASRHGRHVLTCGMPFPADRTDPARRSRKPPGPAG